MRAATVAVSEPSKTFIDSIIPARIRSRPHNGCAMLSAPQLDSSAVLGSDQRRIVAFVRFIVAEGVAHGLDRVALEPGSDVLWRSRLSELSECLVEAAKVGFVLWML